MGPILQHVSVLNDSKYVGRRDGVASGRIRCVALERGPQRLDEFRGERHLGLCFRGYRVSTSGVLLLDLFPNLTIFQFFESLFSILLLFREKV